MRSIFIAGGLLALTLLFPQESRGKIAVIPTRIAEIHSPGTNKGGPFGALTLAWGKEGAKPELRSVAMTRHTRLTAPGKDRRAAISFADLKVGMTVVAEMSANRLGDTSWKLDALHVWDPGKPADPELVKWLGSGPGGFIGSLTEVKDPPAERKGDLGLVLVKRDKEVLLFHITKDTEIIRQTAEGKQSPAKYGDLKAGCEVAVSYPAPLVMGNPPRVPATRVLLLRDAK
jgi:hypothetical protein